MFAQRLKLIFSNKNVIRKIPSRFFAAVIDSENIVRAPHPPLSYPELSVDQYIWRDLDFWSNKIAVVSFH